MGRHIAVAAFDHATGLNGHGAIAVKADIEIGTALQLAACPGYPRGASATGVCSDNDIRGIDTAAAGDLQQTRAIYPYFEIATLDCPDRPLPIHNGSAGRARHNAELRRRAIHGATCQDVELAIASGTARIGGVAADLQIAGPPVGAVAGHGRLTRRMAADNGFATGDGPRSLDQKLRSARIADDKCSAALQ